MKRSRNLLILVVVLILLGGGYALVSLSHPGASDSGSDTQKTKLSVIDSKKIVSVTLNSSSGSYTLVKNGDNWVDKADTSIKLDQTKAGGIITSFANIYADSVVDDNPSSLDEYGLKTPAVTASAVLDDGSSINFNLGDKAPGGAEYYMMMKGDPKLYTISSTDGDNYMYTLSDIRDKTVLSFTTDTVNYIKITTPGQVVELKKLPGDTQALEDSGYGPWIMSMPYKGQYNAVESSAEGILQDLGAITINTFVDDNPVDLSKYGLDKPSKEIDVIGSSGNFKIMFGNAADDGSVYFMTGNSKAVYTIAQTEADTFNETAFSLVDKAPFSSSMADVKQITIENQGRKDVIDITTTTTPAATEGGSPTVTEAVKINGKDIDTTKFQDFYQKLLSLNVEGENDKTITGSPDIKMTFVLGNGLNGQTVISYTPYNSDFYAVTKDGAADFLISKSQLQNVMSSLADLTK